MNNIDIAQAESVNISDNGMRALTDADLASVNGGFGCGFQGSWGYDNESFGGFYDGSCRFGGGYGGRFGGGWSDGRRNCNY